MTQIKLEDVESYLVEMGSLTNCSLDNRGLKAWIRNRFAELRAREEAKTHVK